MKDVSIESILDIINHLRGFEAVQEQIDNNLVELGMAQSHLFKLLLP